MRHLFNRFTLFYHYSPVQVCYLAHCALNKYFTITVSIKMNYKYIYTIKFKNPMRGEFSVIYHHNPAAQKESNT